MTMKTKQFKIGEYAVGGIIKVVMDDKIVSIDALDYVTRKPLPFMKETFMKRDRNEIDQCLINLTTSYYTDKILEYIYNN
jgi:hypothetical protein